MKADINLSSDCATYNERFTDCEITSLYTDKRSKNDPSKPESLSLNFLVIHLKMLRTLLRMNGSLVIMLQVLRVISMSEKCRV